eukprot:1999399-Rhodomonas_salina.1
MQQFEGQVRHSFRTALEPPSQRSAAAHSSHPNLTACTLHQITALRDTSEIVAWDMYGCGKSPKPYEWDAYSHKEQYQASAPEAHKKGQKDCLMSGPNRVLFANQDLLTIYDTYAGKRNIVVGHSYGSSMSLQLASERGQQHEKPILGVVTIGPGARVGRLCTRAAHALHTRRRVCCTVLRTHASLSGMQRSERERERERAHLSLSRSLSVWLCLCLSLPASLSLSRLSLSLSLSLTLSLSRAGFGPSHYPSGSIKLFRYPLILLQLMAPLLRMGFKE